MATRISSLDIRGFRKAHLRQLANYIYERDREGWYYGNKDQFDERHEFLKNWADMLVDIVNDKDYKIADSL